MPAAAMTRQQNYAPDLSTLPQNFAHLSICFVLFTVVDLLVFWQILGHFLATIVDPVIHSIDSSFVNSSILGLGAGTGVGLVSAFFFLNFPLGFLDGRVPLGIAAFRLMCWTLAIAHLLLVTVIVINVIRIGIGGLMTPFALIALPATPLLYFLIHPLLTMRWLDLKSPPETWEKLIGIDGSGKKTIEERGGQASGFAFAIFLTPFACLQARMYVWATVSGLLWLGAIVFLFFTPWHSLIALSASAIIGRQVALAGLRKPTTHPSLSQEERLKRIYAIFTPERLAFPPKFVAPGLVSFLFMLPCEGQFLWFANYIGGEVSTSVIANTPFLPAIMMLFVSAIIGTIGAFVMPMGFRFGIWWYRVFGTLLIILHVLLLLFYWQVWVLPFGLVPSGVLPVLRPIAILLLVLSPLIVAIALSLPGAGRVQNLIKIPPTIKQPI